MTLLDTFIRAKDDISQLCERVRPIDPPEHYYDFIVVGGEYQIIRGPCTQRLRGIAVISIETRLKFSCISPEIP